MSARCVPALGFLAALVLPGVPIAVSDGLAQEVIESDSLVLWPALRWRNIGPNRGGRSITVAGSRARPLEYYFGATGGGVWKTTDGGTSWRPVSDGQVRSSSVGALAVCEANPDIVYAGMGETQLRGNIMPGDGAYRTSDGGKTWTHLGLTETQAIGRIRVHPADCERAWVAALGHPYGANPERGVFRTADGGRTWERVLFRNDSTGAVDLALDPSNPDVVYAALWQVHRKPWGLYSGGPGSGLFKSTDGGTTWAELTRNPGLPGTLIAKIGITVSPADPRRLYAIIEADGGGLFRSDDAGATWELATDDFDLWERGYYYTRLVADPRDRDAVYVLNIDFTRSTDGGRSFRRLRTPHSDHHDVWIAPDDPRRMILANDGGAAVSVNAGESWTSQAYPTAQLYHVITTGDRPYHVCGSQQDNTSICVSSAPGGGFGRIPVQYTVGGGEAGYIAAHPRNPNIFYGGHYDGFLTRFDRATGQTRNIQVWPEKTMGHPSDELTERFQWTSPVIVSRTTPTSLYSASQHLWRTTNEGQSWVRISRDLTRADSATLRPAPAPIRQDRTGADTYATIFSVAVSPRGGSVIWTGSDDGLVHLTVDGGATWKNVTPGALPPFSRITMIEASPHDAATAFVAANRYQLDDRAPYLFRTVNYGRTWTAVTNGFASGDFLRTVREDPARAGLLYAGTEHGVYLSLDRGDRWRPLSLDLPDVQVSDLIVEERDLVIATHGRSFWVLDDIAPVRHLSPSWATSSVTLVQPADPVRGVEPQLQIDYYLGQAASEATIEIVDSAGSLLRSFTTRHSDSRPRSGGEDSAAPTLRAGLNRFTWNLRYPGFTRLPDLILWYLPVEGPVALPGRYRVRVSVDGVAREQGFTVRADPRVPDVPLRDLRERFRLALAIRDRTSDAVATYDRARTVRAAIEDRMRGSPPADVGSTGATLRAALVAIESSLYENAINVEDLKNRSLKLINKIGHLLTVVESAEARPTDQTRVVFRRLEAALAAETARLDRALRSELPAFNDVLARHGLPPVALPSRR